MSDRNLGQNTTPFQASDGDLPNSCFAYVPDPAKPSTRKLKLCGPDGKRDAGIIGAAKAALGKGYRGNRVQLPSSARAGVVARVNAAAKSVGLDPISASELDPRAFDDGASSDGPTEDAVHVDGPIGALAPLNKMRARLKGKMRHGRKLTADDVDEAHKYAKLHALPSKASEGESLAACDRMPWKQFDESEHLGLFVGAFLDDDSADALEVDGGEDADDLHITIAYIPNVDIDPVAFARVVVALDDVCGWGESLSGKVGGYGRFDGSPSSDGKDVFTASPDIPGLDVLRGSVIRALASCGVADNDPAHGWVPHITLSYLDDGADDPSDLPSGTPIAIESLTVSYGDSTVVIPLRGDSATAPVAAYAELPLRFAETPRFPDLPASDFMQFLPQIKPFAEPPQWLQYLPPPGTYTHTSYGKVPMPADRIANFVTQFNQGVYQKNLPIDAEHQTKLSGATGYVKEMRVASDGSAEARIEWTDRGKKLLGSDRFKYFSPEWFDSWTDPVDEKVYHDVAIGGALTTRPFFKERALRPLAASEAGAIVWADDLDSAEPITPPSRQGATHMAEDKNAAPVAMTEEQINKRFAEIESKHATELAELKSAAEVNAAKAKQADERAEKLEAESRTKKFTDEVRGKSDANGTPWKFAEIPEFVHRLERLSVAFGEDTSDIEFWSGVVRRASESQEALVKDGAVFKVFGDDSSGSVENAEPFDVLMAQARTYAESHPETTPERAFAEVVTKDPKNKKLVSQL